MINRQDDKSTKRTESVRRARSVLVAVEAGHGSSDLVRVDLGSDLVRMVLRIGPRVD